MSIRLRPTSEADLNFVLSAEQDEDTRAFVNQWQRCSAPGSFIQSKHSAFHC